MTSDECTREADNLVEETIRSIKINTGILMSDFMKQQLRLELWELMNRHRELISRFVLESMVKK